MNENEEDREVREREYEREVLEELRREMLSTLPVPRCMHAVRFFSSSRGRGRRKRRRPREVILLQYGEDRARGCWRSWSGRTEGGRLPWDQWATEIFGADFCARLSEEGTHPDDYLRNQILKLLREFGGRF